NFHSIYTNIGKTQFSKSKKKFTLSALQLTVDIRSFPARYYSSFPPTSNQCDACKEVLVETTEGNEIILICGHGYHLDCYKKKHNRCEYCVQYYKKGIFDNVKSFVERLKSSDNNLKELIEEDNNNDDENESNDNENNETNEAQILSAQDSINLKYLTALNDIYN
ncbi:19832_t:CDS:1, partial [Gigaspora rosea]